MLRKAKTFREEIYILIKLRNGLDDPRNIQSPEV